MDMSVFNEFLSSKTFWPRALVFIAINDSYYKSKKYTRFY